MVAGLFGSVIEYFSARPLRGRICASKPGGSSMARPVATSFVSPGAERDRLHAVEIHARVFLRSVGVARDHRPLVQFFYSDSRRQLAMITV